jgi:GTP-binding protein
MLDDELISAIEQELPAEVPHVFISSVSGFGIQALKDMLWREITSEDNQLLTDTIIHRRLDGHHRVPDEDAFIFENIPAPADDESDEFIDGDEEDWDDDVEYDWDDTTPIE